MLVVAQCVDCGGGGDDDVWIAYLHGSIGRRPAVGAELVETARRRPDKLCVDWIGIDTEIHSQNNKKHQQKHDRNVVMLFM